MDSLVKCCTEGRMEVGRSSTCDNVPAVLSALQVPNRSREFCTYLGSVCCENGLKEIECTNGMDIGRQDAECNSGQSLDFQRCCELCRIGISVGREREVCDLGQARIGDLWESAFLQCCEEQNPNSRKTEDNPPAEGESVSNICELLPGELCAHECTSVGSSYKCSCRTGYTLMSDGKSCSPLSPQRCGGCTHGCEEQTSGRVCTCPLGYYLGMDNMTCIVEGDWICPPGFRKIVNISHVCHDIDECAEGTNTCDPNQEKCINGVGSYTCLEKPKPLDCKRGYQYSQTHHACIDIDECKDVENPPCDSNQNCENTEGGVNCHCKPGFRQDPITLACIDVNECALRLHNCGQFQRCDNTPGSFVCVRDINCGTGYTLNSHSGRCEDDDECMLETHNCNVQGPGWECHNTMGSFRCLRKPTTTSTTTRRTITAITTSTYRPPVTFPYLQSQRRCPVGYRLSSGNFCTDVDECREGTARCSPGQRCRNIQGAYLCSDPPKCRPGYKLTPDGNKCIDINECVEQEGLCAQKCINLWGSYMCGCENGYTLAPDNRTCIDVDECELGARCQGECVNMPGSFTCQCPPGYILGSSKKACIDIDECEGTTGLCQRGRETCVNIPGSYRCGLIVCPHGYIRDFQHPMRCLREIRCTSEEDIDCIRQPTHISFNFISITSNYTIPRSGFLNLYAVESTFGSIPPKYTMDLVQRKSPPGIAVGTPQHFNLKKQNGAAILQLIHPIEGPQELTIEIKTEFMLGNKAYGGMVHNVDIFVSQHRF